MIHPSRFVLFLWFLALASALAVDADKLPPPAAHQVDFTKEIQPLFELTCIKCHAKGKDKGGFSLETRAAFMKGGDSGVEAVLGKSAESPIVEMVAGIDPDNTMPKKGTKWTPEQVGLLRAWIDQGAAWPETVTFARPAPLNLQPHAVKAPAGTEPNPIDRLLEPYYAANHLKPPAPVEDRVFARRAYLDAVGLLPPPAMLETFLADDRPDKRARWVHQLLQDDRGYAAHWLTFWNDLLRNDYRGTGFIDGGRKQISEWLYDALLTNKPFNQFVAELISPNDQTLGFTSGIIWRGTVPAAMSQPLQAAQSVSQVFLGVNLKCASCHDSFVNDWSLADAYGMAALFADQPIELVHCDKPTGQKAAVRFLYPQLGGFEPDAPKAERMRKLAEILTSAQDGRLSRTLVNRLWARLLGRGLVEPTDDMDQPAWSPALLDWLAEDFVSHGYDLRHALETIMTSRAYQLPTAEEPKSNERFVFRGPLTRRLTAEQFSDAISALTDDWAPLPATLEFDFTGAGKEGDFKMPQWIWTDETQEMASRRIAWRYARAATAAAQEKALAAQKAAEAGDPKSTELSSAALAAARDAEGTAAWAAGRLEVFRHKVAFRKKFQLARAPALAYAAVLASQTYDVHVNGKPVKPKMTDGARNGRVRLFDLTPLLRAGENVVVINVDSHTEKQMNEIEHKEFPSSAQHLNAVSGLAFYLKARSPQGDTEIVSDSSWLVHRAPEGAWETAAFADKDWTHAAPLPQSVTPIDEGPGLEPIRRKDFANMPVALGPALRPAASTAALAGNIRASMLAADPLQAALDRPNREIVTPARATAATTLQALELTNGGTLSGAIQRGAHRFAAAPPSLDQLFEHALGRPPSESERAVATEALGSPANADGWADLLWSLVNLPEFQFIN